MKMVTVGYLTAPNKQEQNGAPAALKYNFIYLYIDSYTNLLVAQKIVLIMHESIASPESRFSKLKEIKTCHRSTINQDGINKLILYIRYVSLATKLVF